MGELNACGRVGSASGHGRLLRRLRFATGAPDRGGRCARTRIAASAIGGIAGMIVESAASGEQSGAFKITQVGR